MYYEVKCPVCQQSMIQTRRLRRTWEEWDIEFHCLSCGREVRLDEQELERNATRPSDKRRP